MCVSARVLLLLLPCTLQKSQQLLKAADIVVKTYGRNKAWREGQARECGALSVGVWAPLQHSTGPLGALPVAQPAWRD